MAESSVTNIVQSKKFDWLAVAIGVAAYVSCLHEETKRGDKTGWGSRAGGFLAIYGLTKIKPIYGGVAAAAVLSSEVIRELRRSPAPPHQIF